MKAVNVAELKNRLSSYLQLVRDGEEVVVKDRDRPIARITPYDISHLSESERRLVASGALKLAEEETPDWNKFLDRYFKQPGAKTKTKTKISAKKLIRAVIEEREEGW